MTGEPTTNESPDPDGPDATGTPPATTTRPHPLARPLVVWVTAMALLLAGTWALSTFRASQDVSPGAAPPIEIDNLDPGQPPISLAGYRGRAVVVNFWATWCVPCRTELPAFQQEHTALGDRAVFLGVNTQDNRDYARALLRDLGVAYPSGFDPAGTVAGAYGLYGMPTTVLVDPTGQIAERHTGELTRDHLDELIRTKLDLK
jgi:thiol-disulfide isomerase/thioredoxin